MRVGVYGLGRFGAFWARVLSEHKLEVYGYSRHPKDPIEGVKAVSEEEVLSCDVIFLCVAISSFSEVVERIKDKIKPGALVMDTCSVKLYPADIMQKRLANKCSLIATHPMFGPDSGKNGVKGLPMIICPLSAPVVEVSKWSRLFQGWGLRVIRMTCDEHDRQAAWSQGITHLVGRVLDGMDLRDTPIATTGFLALRAVEEQTCHDPLQLFYDLQRYNPYTREMRQSFHQSVEKIMKDLKSQEQL